MGMITYVKGEKAKARSGSWLKIIESIRALITKKSSEAGDKADKR